MSNKRMRSMSKICCGCRDSLCIFCMSQIKTQVTDRNWSQDNKGFSDTKRHSECSDESAYLLLDRNVLQRGGSRLCELCTPNSEKCSIEKHLEPTVPPQEIIACQKSKQLDMQMVRENLKLVKSRQHPMQLATDSQRFTDSGVPRIEQLLRKRAELAHMKLLMENNGQPIGLDLVYPDWLTFRLRIKKLFADLRWRLFVSHRQRLRQMQPDNIQLVADIKDSDKYSLKYIDTWSVGVSVSVKNHASIKHAILAAFHRLALDKSSDFRYSLFCFFGDTLKGGDQAIEPIEVFNGTPVQELYRQNISEIFINDNKVAML